MFTETKVVKESPEAGEARVLAFRDSLARFLVNTELVKRAVDTYLIAEPNTQWLPLIPSINQSTGCDVSLAVNHPWVIQITKTDGTKDYYRFGSEFSVTTNQPYTSFTDNQQKRVRDDQLKNLNGSYHFDFDDPIKDGLFAKLESYHPEHGGRSMTYGAHVPTLEESLVENASTLFANVNNVSLREGIVSAINSATTKSWTAALAQNKI